MTIPAAVEAAEYARIAGVVKMAAQVVEVVHISVEPYTESQ